MTRFVDRFEIECDQRWEEMTPVGEGRHCAHCDQTVIDLTRLTRKEAQPYLRSRESICVRTMIDLEGEPIFRIEPKKSVGLIAAAAIALGCSARAPVTSHAPPAQPVALMEPSEIPVGVAADEIAPEVLAENEIADEEPKGPESVKRQYRRVMGRIPAHHY